MKAARQVEKFISRMNEMNEVSGVDLESAMGNRAPEMEVNEIINGANDFLNTHVLLTKFEGQMLLQMLDSAIAINNSPDAVDLRKAVLQRLEQT